MSPPVNREARGNAHPSPLLESALPTIVAPPQDISTSGRSVVLRLDTAQGSFVAKSASPDVLRCDRWAYEILLPAIGLTGPAFKAWVHTDSETWLVVDYLRGRRPQMGDLDDVTRISSWAARLHARTQGAIIAPPVGPPRPSALTRLTSLAATLDRRTAGGLEALEACREVERSLPLVDEAAAELPACIVHGDLSEWNIMMAMEGVIAVDWERVSRRSPSIDLATCDMSVYRNELERQGVRADLGHLARGRWAGVVLASLSHDLARKPLRTQRRYLLRITSALQHLRNGS